MTRVQAGAISLALLVGVPGLAVPSFVIGDPSMDITASPDAETTVRTHLGKQGTAPADLVRVRGTGLPYFQYTRADGTRGGAIVVGGKVFVEGARSNRTVGAILRAARAHETHGVDANDLVFLLDRYGSFKGQTALGKAIASLAWPPGYPPRLEWGKRRATLTLHWMPTSRRGHGEGRSSRLTWAVLTIPATYGLSWKLATVAVDAAVFTAPPN